MKLYIQESLERTSDGDFLRVINVHKSKPKTFSYIVWK